MKHQEKRHLYLMPGMAASPKIFEFIRMPETFEVHHLSWFPPHKNEALATYAKRMSERVLHENPILMGVSFGGILIQEMVPFLKNPKLILISTVKSHVELPKAMKMAQVTQLHKLLPTQWIKNFETLALFAFGEGIKKRVALYKRYLSERDAHYLSWSIHAIVHWSKSEPDVPFLHIHGKTDTVFPIKNLKNPVHSIDGGHAMIINKAQWFNKNLPTLIFENSL